MLLLFLELCYSHNMFTSTNTLKSTKKCSWKLQENKWDWQNLTQAQHNTTASDHQCLHWVPCFTSLPGCYIINAKKPNPEPKAVDNTIQSIF